MKTTYITTLSTRFNPFATTGKIPRLFLNLLPASAHKTIKITTKQLPRTSVEPALLEIGLKDGKSMKFSWSADEPAAVAVGGAQTKQVEKVKLEDIVEQVNRHARQTARKDELNG